MDKKLNKEPETHTRNKFIWKGQLTKGKNTHTLTHLDTVHTYSNAISACLLYFISSFLFLSTNDESLSWWHTQKIFIGKMMLTFRNFNCFQMKRSFYIFHSSHLHSVPFSNGSLFSQRVVILMNLIVYNGT